MRSSQRKHGIGIAHAVRAAAAVGGLVLSSGCPGASSSGTGSTDDAAGSTSTGDQGTTAGLGSESTGAPPSDTTSSDGGAQDTTAGPSDTTAGPSDTSDTSGTSDTGDPPATCPPTHTCIAEPPEGWTGPVNVQDVPAAGSLLDCDGAYPLFLEEHDTDPAGDSAQCTCECGDVSGVSCTYRIAHFPLANCAYDPETFTPQWTNLAALNGCVDIADSTSDWWSLQANVQGAGSCTPSYAEQIPTVGYQSKLRLCGGAALGGGCEPGEVCAPIASQPFSSDICIYQAGEHECPEGPYTQRSIHHTGHQDSRDCSPACTCDAAQGSCTGVQATLYRDVDNCTPSGLCQNPPCSETKNQGCSQVAVSQVQSVRRTADATYSGSCAPQGYQPFGEVTPEDPITVCCAP